MVINKAGKRRVYGTRSSHPLTHPHPGVTLGRVKSQVQRVECSEASDAMREVGGLCAAIAGRSPKGILRHMPSGLMATEQCLVAGDEALGRGPIHTSLD